MDSRVVYRLSVVVLIIASFYSGYCKDAHDGKDEKGHTSSDSKVTYLDSLNKGRELVLSDNDIVSLSQSVESTIPKGKKEISEGYRIQLMASSSGETVRARKKMIENELRLKVYIIFDEPYYKVYVGDYKTRRDAESALNEIKQSGYPDAWIVKSKVFIDE